MEPPEKRRKRTKISEQLFTSETNSDIKKNSLLIGFDVGTFAVTMALFL